jgi:hypothetical protein
MEYYNTLDLDSIDKKQLEEITKKIKKCKNCLSVQSKDSSSKGYHVSIICKIKCDICRLVFDDQKRYEIDLGRDEKFKNTTFDEKEWFRGNMNTIKQKCDRCFHYGINTTLNKRDIDLETVKEKMRIGKINGYSPIVVYLGYDYFECPICHWFKFVKKK